MLRVLGGALRFAGARVLERTKGIALAGDLHEQRVDVSIAERLRLGEQPVELARRECDTRRPAPHHRDLLRVQLRRLRRHFAIPSHSLC